MATSTNMSTTDLNRLRCSQCSKAYKEAKLLNRHRREKHFQKQMLPCDYPDCSINFQCLRFKIEHMKKKHANQIARSLSPDEQSKLGSEENDTPASIIIAPPKPGQAY
jgi:hypothetical protein